MSAAIQLPNGKVISRAVIKKAHSQRQYLIRNQKGYWSPALRVSMSRICEWLRRHPVASAESLKRFVKDHLQDLTAIEVKRKSKKRYVYEQLALDL